MINEFADCYECRHFSLNFFTDKPKIFHSELRLEKPFHPAELRSLKKIVSQNNFESVSFHLAADYTNPIICSDMFQPQGIKYNRDEIFSNVRINVRSLRESLPDGVVVSLENNNYYPTGAYDTVTNTETINQILCDNNIMLLLDLAHLRITAFNRGYDLFSYAETFLLDKVIQFHISGCRLENGVMMDAHDEPDEIDWKLMVHLLNKCGDTRYVTLEYYRDIERLKVLNRKVSLLIKG
ncbi:DUF692 family protein [Candidatus Woesearchaeota archaeon]|nr:DUF692 family protein [Candidatus Woesearchaeota archaeon]